MGIAIIPAASAAGKTEFVTTLTSGTSWTVPAGVNYINVILTGGGGGGNLQIANNNVSASPGAGGTTTFTGATSAAGGSAGIVLNGSSNGNPTFDALGNAGLANTGQAGNAGVRSQAASATATAFAGIAAIQKGGSNGQVIASTLNTTPGATINYAIGAGGNQGSGTSNDNNLTYYGNNPGGSGKVEIHYWA
jgi:hypothetical protein